MIAALPMYDRPETAAAHDTFWLLVRDALRADGIEAPDALTRGRPPMADWRDPGLVLGQTCGLPYRAVLHGRVELVSTADYGLDDTPPGHSRSVLVARADDPRAWPLGLDGARLAYNGPDSQSGWAGPLIEAARSGIRLRPGPCTGAHRRSAEAVAAGGADLAAIDAVTWRGIVRWDQCARDLRVVGRTAPVPGLPFIAARGRDRTQIAEAVDAAIAALPEAAADRLGIVGAVRIAAADYLAVPTPGGFRHDAAPSPLHSPRFRA